MNGSSRPSWRLPVAALGVAFATVFFSAQAGATRSSATFQIAAGTWVTGPTGALLGPAWELDGPTPTFAATVFGPGGFSHRVGGPAQRFPGMPSALSLHWCSTCQVASNGSWSATGDDGSQVSFSLDQSSRLTPVDISHETFSDGTLSASWTAGTDAASFIVYVQPSNSTSATDWTAGKILAEDARTVSFSGLNLTTGTSYSLVVFAFSADISSDVLPPVFNVASDNVDFVPGLVFPRGCCFLPSPLHKVLVPALDLLPVAKTEWIAVLDDWLEHGKFSDPHTCAAAVVARTHAPPAFKEGSPLVHALDLYELSRCTSPTAPARIVNGMSDRQVADLAGVPVPWRSGPHSWWYRKPAGGVRVAFSADGYVTNVQYSIPSGDCPANARCTL